VTIGSLIGGGFRLIRERPGAMLIWMLIQLAGQASSDPAAPWGPTFGAIALGLVAAGSIAVLGLVLQNYRRGEATA